MIFRSKVNVFNKPSCSLRILLISLLLVLSLSAERLGAGLPDTPFIQEYHKPCPIASEGAANDVRAIVTDNNGNIWAATKAGIYRLNKGQKIWQAVMKETDTGPAYDIIVDNAGALWAGAWNGIYQSTPSGLKKVPHINHPIPALCASDNEIIALGAGCIYRLTNIKCTSEEIPYSKSFRAVLPGKKGGLWIATGLGLYHHTDKGYKLYQAESELVSPDLYDIAFDSKGSLWIGSLGGITVYKGQRRAESFTPKQGLPSVAVRCVAHGPDDRMWVGT